MVPRSKLGKTGFQKKMKMKNEKDQETFMGRDFSFFFSFNVVLFQLLLVVLVVDLLVMMEVPTFQ